MTVNDELYIENLEEYVNDENKVVTYKWLSRTLEVHVNQAKQMLYSYVQHERNKKDNDQLNVTYFVSGVIEQNGEKIHKVQIVPESYLEATKSQLKPVTSCHIYSIHKSKVKDTNALYMSDTDIVKEHLYSSNKFSAIRCMSAKLRSNDELVKLRTAAQPTTTAPSFTKPKTDSNQTTKSTTQPVNKKQPAGIAGMFASAGSKKKDNATKSSPVKDNSSQESVKSTSEDTSKKPTKAKQGGIANFFGNQAAKPKKSPEKVEKPKPESSSGKESQEKKTSPVKSKQRSPSPKPKAKTKGRRREESDNDETQEKKRRRIKAAVWSDSSEDEDMEEEEPLPPREPTPPPDAREPTPSPVKQPSPSPEKMDHSSERAKDTPSGLKRRKRQKKLVSKTSVDDNGYMVTEKVYESCSESCSDEEPIPPTPPVKPAAKSMEKQDKKSPRSKNKKSPASSAGGKKQASLMSFFKKK